MSSLQSVVAINAIAAALGQAVMLVSVLRWVLGVLLMRTHYLKGADSTKALKLMKKTFVHSTVVGDEENALPSGLMFSLEGWEPVIAYADHTPRQSGQANVTVAITCRPSVFARRFAAFATSSGCNVSEELKTMMEVLPGATKKWAEYSMVSTTLPQQAAMLAHFSDRSRYDIARRREIGWGRHGIILRGPPGVGKSVAGELLLHAQGVKKFVRLDLFVGKLCLADLLKELDDDEVLGVILDEGIARIESVLVHGKVPSNPYIWPVSGPSLQEVNSALDALLKRCVVVITSNVSRDWGCEALRSVDPSGSIMDRFPHEYVMEDVRKKVV